MSYETKATKTTDGGGSRRQAGGGGGFRLYDDAVRLVRMVKPLWMKIGRHNRDLRRQLEKSTCAVPLNVSEGRNRWNGHGRERLETAMQSARECVATLEVAEAAGYLGAEEIAAAVDLGDKVVATAWKCLHPKRG